MFVSFWGKRIRVGFDRSVVFHRSHFVFLAPSSLSFFRPMATDATILPLPSLEHPGNSLKGRFRVSILFRVFVLHVVISHSNVMLIIVFLLRYEKERKKVVLPLGDRGGKGWRRVEALTGAVR